MENIFLLMKKMIRIYSTLEDAMVSIGNYLFGSCGFNKNIDLKNLRDY